MSGAAAATKLNVLGGQLARFLVEINLERGGFERRVALLLDDAARQLREVELELRGVTPAAPTAGEARFAHVAARTLALLDYGWGIRSAASSGHGELWILFAPHALDNKTWFLAENGGEVTLAMPNAGATHSIPYTAGGLALGAGTMAYRIAAAMQGLPIDWNERADDALMFEEEAR